MSTLPAHKIKLGLTTATIWKNGGITTSPGLTKPVKAIGKTHLDISIPTSSTSPSVQNVLKSGSADNSPPNNNNQAGHQPGPKTQAAPPEALITAGNTQSNNPKIAPP